jgi:hypothetical protein
MTGEEWKALFLVARNSSSPNTTSASIAHSRKLITQVPNLEDFKTPMKSKLSAKNNSNMKNPMTGSKRLSF